MKPEINENLSNPIDNSSTNLAFNLKQLEFLLKSKLLIKKNSFKWK